MTAEDKMHSQILPEEKPQDKPSAPSLPLRMLQKANPKTGVKA